jgi:hypothetical protein
MLSRQKGSTGPKQHKDDNSEFIDLHTNNVKKMKANLLNNGC